MIPTSTTAQEALRGLSADLVQRLRKIRAVVFDFDGVFTDNAVWVLEDGRELVRCTRADGIGLTRLASVGVQPLVLSTEENPVVSARCRKLKLRCIQNCSDKGAALPQIVEQELGCTLAELAYMGNDINDSGALEICGLPVVVADAHPDVLPLAAWRSSNAGGHGAVREFCELIIAARLQDA